MAARILLQLVAPLSLAATLIVLALISRRFGRATGAARYYAGFVVAALLVGGGGLARLGLEALVYAGLTALGLTLAVATAWRYWSWLLAERG